ncbi:MAG TPA: ABC transporter ATP-binding protein [Chlamydiales bacterium]|nr:ABC transporter ATP-binding protein [Chlamydiales bacterium]
MRLLLKSAIRSRKHFSFALLTICTLLLATFADQLERCAFGLLANTGVDFFTLFGKEEGKRIRSVDHVSLEDMKEKWQTIEKKDPSVLTKQDAAIYIASKKETNPVNWIYRRISSNFDIERDFTLLITVLMVIALFKAVILFSSRFTTQVLAIRVTRDLRQQYFEHIQSLPFQFYQDHNVGSLTSRVIGDAGQIASSLNSLLTNYLQTPFTIISTLTMCFFMSWQLSFIIFLGMPLIVGPVVILTTKVKKVSRQLQKNQEKFTSVLLDFLSGIHTIKIFAREQFSLQKYKEQNDQMALLESKNAKYSLLTRPVLHTVATACLAAVCLIGLYVLHMTLAQLIVFCALLHLFYDPVKKFAEENTNIQRGVVAAERMFEVLHLKPVIQDKPGSIDLTTFEDRIEFDNVSFKYGKDWVLRDLSFTVKKGETVAIVGPTGAGKSTIVQLLPRLFDVQEGEIRIDGKPLQSYTQKSLRNLISFVPQKPFLFYDTVLENIAFGETHTREEIEEAAKKAYAHEFIVNLSEQYDTLLAETGKTLSGGQQQRLAIARALVKKSPVLIMDEATSSLDAISESRIQKAIVDLHGSVTQILIAHRLTTIEHADKILYLERGEKIGEGTKAELLKNCPQFRLMWETFHRTEQVKRRVK